KPSVDPGAPMAIVFSCACGAPLTAPGRSAGQPARCPACKALVTVPAASEPGVPPSSAYAVKPTGPAAPGAVPPEPMTYTALSVLAWALGALALVGLVMDLTKHVPLEDAIPVAAVRLVGAGVMLLAVDVARNVRAMRWTK